MEEITSMVQAFEKPPVQNSVNMCTGTRSDPTTHASQAPLSGVSSNAPQTYLPDQKDLLQWNSSPSFKALPQEHPKARDGELGCDTHGEGWCWIPENEECLENEADDAKMGWIDISESIENCSKETLKHF